MGTSLNRNGSGCPLLLGLIRHPTAGARRLLFLTITMGAAQRIITHVLIPANSGDLTDAQTDLYFVRGFF